MRITRVGCAAAASRPTTVEIEDIRPTTAVLEREPGCWRRLASGTAALRRTVEGRPALGTPLALQVIDVSSDRIVGLTTSSTPTSARRRAYVANRTGMHPPLMDHMLTVGHGTLGPAEFVELVRAAGVDAIADVRRYPASRRQPHVAREAMGAWLPSAGIAYAWIPALGGRRKGVPESRHVGLRNEQFRAYADHMETDEFRRGLDELRQLTAAGTTALMCAESLWWRCHRRLLADHLLLIEGVRIEHLFHDGGAVAHPPTPEARVENGSVVYDLVDQPTLFDR